MNTKETTIHNKLDFFFSIIKENKQTLSMACGCQSQNTRTILYKHLTLGRKLKTKRHGFQPLSLLLSTRSILELIVNALRGKWIWS